MKNVFIVLAKLIGILQLYWGISYLAALVLAYRQMQNIQFSSTVPPESGGMPLLPILGYVVLTAGVAYLLLFRTNSLTRILGIKEYPDADKLPIHLVLPVGVKLIGVYLVALAIPDLFKSLSEWIFTIREYSSTALQDTLYTDMFRDAAAKGFFTSGMPPFIKLCLGSFLAVKTSSVVRLISKDQKEAPPVAGDRCEAAPPSDP